MEIRALDLTDDALLHRVAGVAARVQAHGRPHAGPFSEATWTAARRTQDSSEHQHVLVALDRDDVLGFAFGYTFLLDNRDLAWLAVQVDPPHRGRGVGTALLERLTEVVRDEGRHVLLAETKVPFDQLETHPQRLFLERRGHEFSNMEVVRHLALPVADARLDAWEARAQERAAAYRVQTHADGFPDELMPSLCRLLGLLGVDAPTGALELEEEQISPALLTERYARAREMGIEVVETVALGPDGDVVAQSTIAVTRGLPDAEQWGTYVDREHRGHSLGLAVKVASLRAVQAAHPHLRRVVTQNAEDNRWMVAINEELGFEPVEASLEMVRRL